jgi:molybdopterin biosynthesis enzyme
VPEVKALEWQGSGDIAALVKANCFLVVPADRENIEIGARVSVLLRKDVV